MTEAKRALAGAALLAACIFAAVTVLGEVPARADSAAARIDNLIRGIRWLGHASFLIESEINIYIDPYELPRGLPLADLVLITHEHRDHFSVDDLGRIADSSTVLVASACLAGRTPGGMGRVHYVVPGDSLRIGSVFIRAVPAYNVKKKFHPRSKQFVGFVIQDAGGTIYHAGDTDLIPEMEDIEADIALLPVGGTFTMDGAEAARAANLIAPDVAIPMHWGRIVGSRDDAEIFKAECDMPVVLLEDESQAPDTETQ